MTEDTRNPNAVGTIAEDAYVAVMGAEADPWAELGEAGQKPWKDAVREIVTRTGNRTAVRHREVAMIAGAIPDTRDAVELEVEAQAWVPDSEEITGEYEDDYDDED